MTAPDVRALAALVGRALTQDEVLIAAAAFGQGDRAGWLTGYAKGLDTGFSEGHRQGFIEGHDHGISQGMLKAKDLLERAAHGG